MSGMEQTADCLWPLSSREYRQTHEQECDEAEGESPGGEVHVV